MAHTLKNLILALVAVGAGSLISTSARSADCSAAANGMNAPMVSGNWYYRMDNTAHVEANPRCGGNSYGASDANI